MTPGLPEIIIIALIVFFLFGAKQIPKWFRALGETKKELRNIQEELEKED